MLPLGMTRARKPKKSAGDVAGRSAAEVLALKKANAWLLGLSITDELTGLYNRRYFHEQLEIEYARCMRYKRPFAVIFIDVDDFKKYNDRWGHPAGDELLREISLILRMNCRRSDLAYRIGGEEFAILCPEVAAAEARKFAERIRQVIATYPFPNAESQPLGCISVSSGVASYPRQGQSIETLLQSADRALYSAKRAGKNQVKVARSSRS